MVLTALKAIIAASGKAQRAIAAEIQAAGVSMTANRLSDIVCGYRHATPSERHAICAVLGCPENVFESGARIEVRSIVGHEEVVKVQ